MINMIVKLINKLRITGFFHIFGSSVINKIVSFLSSIVLVRILSKGEYGIFTYGWNIYCIILLVSGLGMDSGVLQLCSENSQNEKLSKSICGYAVKLGLTVNFLLAIAIFCISIFAPLTIGGADTLLRMLCLLPLIQLLYNLSVSYLRAQKRNQDYSRLSVLNTVMIFVFSVCGALLFHEKGLVLGYYLSYILSVIYVIFVLRINLFQKVDKPDHKTVVDIRNISIVSMCNNGLSQLMYLLDVFVLGIVAAEENILASYKVATVIPSALTFIPLSLVIYLYPYFAQHRNDRKWCIKNYRLMLSSLAVLNAFVSIILFSFAPLIIRILFGENYMDAVPVFRILSVNYFISGTFRVLSGNLLVTQRKLKFNLIVAIISGTVNAIADYIFIKKWGSLGAAYASVLVVLISSIISTTYLIYTFRNIKGKETVM